MKFYLNDMKNIDPTWTQDEGVKNDSNGLYVESLETYKWYESLNKAYETLKEESCSEIVRRLEDEGSINEWEDYIFYGEKLESVVENGDEDWLLAYADATDEVMNTAIDEYEEYSTYVGYDPYIAKEYMDMGLPVYDIDYGYIAIKR